MDGARCGTLRTTGPIRASGWSTTSTALGSWVLSDLRTQPTTLSLLPPAQTGKHLHTFVFMRWKHTGGYKKNDILSGQYETCSCGQWEVLSLYITWQNTLPFHDKNKDTLIFFYGKNTWVSEEWVNNSWWGWQNRTELGKCTHQCDETQGNKV